MEKQTFTYSTYIHTTPEQLWEALTSSQFTRQYWGGTAFETDWKPGSTISMTRPQGTGVDEKIGKVITFDPPKFLSYTGIGGTNSIVTFEIVPLLPDQVRLNITHEDIEPELGTRVAEGWFAIMSSLKTMLETGTALDYSWWRG
jgi:uncharacterized protein YndB with AHSA1/START domain